MHGKGEGAGAGADAAVTAGEDDLEEELVTGLTGAGIENVAEEVVADDDDDDDNDDDDEVEEEEEEGDDDDDGAPPDVPVTDDVERDAELEPGGLLAPPLATGERGLELCLVKRESGMSFSERKGMLCPPMRNTFSFRSMHA